MSDLLHDVFRPPVGELEALGLASPPRASTGSSGSSSNGNGSTSASAGDATGGGQPVNGTVRSPRSGSPERADEGASSEDEEVGVVSGSATPVRLSRPGSPTRLPGASSRRAPGPLILSQASKTDPFRRLNTELVIRILMLLPPEDLARCSRVCKKWCNSQAANFVWFRHTRNAALPDSAPPPTALGSTTPTWTKRESKQNWRREYAAQIAKQRDDPPPTLPPFSRGSSRPSSRAGTPSGYKTPREIKEEEWAKEEEQKERPSKVEMREAYKELGGRKARVKGSGGWEKSAGRDRTAYGDDSSGFGEEY